MAAEIPTTMTFEGHTFPAGTFLELQHAFLAHIEMPFGCGAHSPDMAADAPSKALAALWLRAAFHDVGKFDPATQTPVAGLLPQFLNETENAGIGDSIATRFAPKMKFPYSTADYIALAAQVAVAHCGGPRFDFLQARLDAPEATAFAALPAALPDDARESYAAMKAKLRRLGLNNEDIVALVVGSHSLGGVHKAISPHATAKEFEPFDATPGIFDNDVFKQTLKGNCLLNIDCGIAQDPELRPLVELYAADEQAFFKQYEVSFQKMTTIGQDRTKMRTFHLDIGVHKNLFAEEGPGAATPGQGSSSPSASGNTPSQTANGATSSNAGSFPGGNGVKQTGAVTTIAATKSGSSGLILFQTLIFILTASFLIL